MNKLAGIITEVIPLYAENSPDTSIRNVRLFGKIMKLTNDVL